MERAPRNIRIRGQEAEQPAVATYAIYATCPNCDWKGEVKIPKGTPIKKGDPVEMHASCPECECYTLIRVEKPREVTRDNDWADEWRRIIQEQPAVSPVTVPTPIGQPFEPYAPGRSDPWLPYTIPYRYIMSDGTLTSDLNLNGMGVTSPLPMVSTSSPRATATDVTTSSTVNHTLRPDRNGDAMLDRMIMNMCTDGILSTATAMQELGLSSSTTA